MISAGIDIGSRTIKLVIVEDGKIKSFSKYENSFDTLAKCSSIIEQEKFDIIISTGYGRNLFSEMYNCENITEIKAFGIGAKYFLPSTSTILDIGGQDIKVISIDDKGKVIKFEMNDKCSAGTGRFLEIMSMSLAIDLKSLGSISMTAQKSEKINNMCTVFAESEVISLLSKGSKREDVAFGIHQAIVNRTLGMINRVSVKDDFLFAGGVAYNSCIKYLLEKELKTKIHVIDEPQIVGATGAAIYGQELLTNISDKDLSPKY